MENHLDTIAAVATPPGKGGIGVIRVSGAKSTSVARDLLGVLPKPRYAGFHHFRDRDGMIIDSGIALFYPAPKSFTGEDILEIQGHGGTVVMDMLLQRILDIGVRLARPGEFSERAFLNDKIDLAQAEAIADLINSSTEQAVRSAQKSLAGEFSVFIHQLVDKLIELRCYIEASIDFVDEDIDFLTEGNVCQHLIELSLNIEKVHLSAEQGCLLRDGMTVVIAGKPNVGKSSLLNYLANRDAAIVSEIEGTTRDVLTERIQIEGMPLHIVDTAGIRDSNDLIEKEGIRRAKDEISNADRLLWIIDDREKEEIDFPIDLPINTIPVTRIYNKIDLTGTLPGISELESGTTIALSLQTKAGVDHLITHLKKSVGYKADADGVFMARRRHIDAMERASTFIANSINRIKHPSFAIELLAEDLRAAQTALSEITGEYTSDDLLGEIFSSFCIGK
ncbi:MAG: tRNA uridine-5-carboxymethylaminomethyl(34) synthesis GTPase MnmE [Methylococcales bacterium]